jgi:hypothetical protein
MTLTSFVELILLGLPQTLLALILLVLPQSLRATGDLFRNFRPYMLRIVTMGALASGLFLLPFVLWSQGTIPPYLTAWFFALLLALCALIAAGFALQPVLSVAVQQTTSEKSER